MEPLTSCDSGIESVTTCDEEFVIPPTPTCVGEFSREWIKYVMDGWFAKNNIRTEAVDILSFYAALNTVQVIKRQFNVFSLSSQSFEGWEEFQQFPYIVRSVLAFCPMCENMKCMIKFSILHFVGCFTLLSLFLYFRVC